MGGGKGGSFGNTKGSKTSFKEALDHISNALAVASFIPGADTITNLISIPVDLARGDFVSAGLDAVGVIPIIGEIADIAKTADKVSDVAKAIDKITDASKVNKKTHNVLKSKRISNAVLKNKRVGSAMKSDSYHAFNDIIDNYASKGKTFSIKGADKKIRKLYQVEGSLNGRNGVFEWILDKDKGVTHRRFIPDGKITGKPNYK